MNEEFKKREQRQGFRPPQDVRGNHVSVARMPRPAAAIDTADSQRVDFPLDELREAGRA